MTSPSATIRKVAVPIFVVATAGIVMYPEIRTLVRGDPLGSGITDIVVGVLAILLYAGLELINQTSTTSGFGTRSERWAVLALLTAVIGINAVLIYAVPDSPAAVGMLVVCVVFALIVLFGSTGRQSNPQP